MRKFKPNPPLGIGLIISAVIQVTCHLTDIPTPLYMVLMAAALIPLLVGIIMFARSPEMKNSKIRKFKLRLIGRSPRE
ncbi:MAG TPA: hypothetical protein DEQ02_09560 [Ruminococcaceae bacterium]|nr:hypothetical protein [Oscillospiraceae bacterium]